MIFRWIYLPPLLIYLSAGVSGLTAIVGVFFLKDYLNLSAAFIASIGFWAGIPWALKMPVGFLVDKFWSKKNYLVFLGAVIIFISILIMFFLITKRDIMIGYLPAENWFVLSAILTPIGYVIQDVVADAMTVEAVESKSIKKNNLNISKNSEHTLLQLYGRFAIIFGSLLVGLLNIFIFSGTKNLAREEIISSYATIYFIALFIPLLSISGVFLSMAFKNNFVINKDRIGGSSSLDLKIFIVSILFVIFAILFGSIKFAFSQEIILFTSLVLIFVLIKYLIKPLSMKKKYTILGTAVIIFVYRSMPGPGAGLTWFEIDILKFDQTFLSLLSVNAAFITLICLFIFRKIIIETSLAKLFLILAVISGLLYLPSLFLYYGFHNYTISISNGLIDARFIAFINTSMESPVGQIAMIPLLAWIAKNAPINLKATFFAVFASFTNLALSARELFTKYINKVFIIKRDVIDQETKLIIEKANYASLDELLITIIIISITVPVITIFLIQRSKFKSSE